MSICVALLDLNRSCEMGRPSRLFSSPREISGYKCYLLFAPLIYCKANKVHYSYQFVRIRLPACLPLPNPIPIPPLRPSSSIPSFAISIAQIGNHFTEEKRNRSMIITQISSETFPANTVEPPSMEWNCREKASKSLIVEISSFSTLILLKVQLFPFI